MERFDYKGVDEEQVKAINEVREGVKQLFLTLEANCPNGREKALAITKLEELSMWANKSISHSK